MRGRPPITRNRVLSYWTAHGPCPVMQVCRSTGAERSHVKRILRNFAGGDFCPMSARLVMG
jgi:hypothetical protein